MIYFIIITILILFMGGAYKAYLIGEAHRKYFDTHNIPYVPFSVPIFGNMWEMITKKKHMKDIIIEGYNMFPDKKYFGLCFFANTYICIRDLYILKQVNIKEFESFHDHSIPIEENVDKMFGLGLISLKGQKWQDMRATFSPAFTSLKMRHMFGLIVECAESTTGYLLQEAKKIQNEEFDCIEVEMRDLAERFTSDSVASSVFGLKTDSLRDSENLFYKMGTKIISFKGFLMLRFFGCIVMPRLMRFLGISIFSKKIMDYFFGIVKDTMDEREQLGIVRPDMMQLLLEAKKGTLSHESYVDKQDTGFATVEESEIGKRKSRREWTHDELAVQAFTFLFAGYETLSALISFVAYELACNPDIQEQLQDEVDIVGQYFEYEDLMEMKYLDMVVSETLRKWPPNIMTDRKCTKTIRLPPVDDESNVYCMVEAGRQVLMPIIAIHQDEKYFPNPEVFNPERFSDENKENIVRYSYLPFGIGPRNCIGSRFALMESKAFIFHLVRNFSIVAIPKTENPIQLKKGIFSMITENGIWVGLKPRKRFGHRNF